MAPVLTPKIVNGITCYSHDVASSYDDYPDAFELTDDNAERSFWVRSRNRLFGWLVQQERKRLGRAKLLEVGCGTGEFVQHLLKDEQLSITGSEIYLSGLQYARKRLPDVDFIQFDVTQGILGETFDIITAFDVLEHIEADETSMRHIAEMLSDDGVFILSVPQYMFMWSTLDELVCHKRRYSRREMLSKLRANGLEPVRTTSHVFTLFPLMALSRLLDRFKRAAPSEDVALSDRVTFPAPVNWLFDKVMRIDEALIKLGMSLPFGGTLVVVARKSPASKTS